VWADDERHGWIQRHQCGNRSRYNPATRELYVDDITWAAKEEVPACPHSEYRPADQGDSYGLRGAAAVRAGMCSEDGGGRSQRGGGKQTPGEPRPAQASVLSAEFGHIGLGRLSPDEVVGTGHAVIIGPRRADDLAFCRLEGNEQPSPVRGPGHQVIGTGQHPQPAGVTSGRRAAGHSAMGPVATGRVTSGSPRKRLLGGGLGSERRSSDRGSRGLEWVAEPIPDTDHAFSMPDPG
jgi:hypothetical protein